jgi:hypothetical protein
MIKADNAFLVAALEGYEAQVQQLNAAIKDVRNRIAAAKGGTSAPAAPGVQRRRRSAAVRKRMAAAQRKRWAAVRRAKPEKKEAGAKPVRRAVSKNRKAKPKTAETAKAARGARRTGTSRSQAQTGAVAKATKAIRKVARRIKKAVAPKPASRSKGPSAAVAAPATSTLPGAVPLPLA